MVSLNRIEVVSYTEFSSLVYRILDANGVKTGVPVKASAFHFKPTLKSLERNFAAGEPERFKHKARVKNAVDLALLNQKHSLESLGKALGKQGLRVILRKSDRGLVYGLTYVDMRTKCVYNGSYLGKNYSAKAVQQRCVLQPQTPETRPDPKVKLKHTSLAQSMNQSRTPTPFGQYSQSNQAGSAPDKDLLEGLLLPLPESGSVPWQLRRKRKKKRKTAR